MNSSQKGASLIITFFILTIMLSIALGVSVVLFNEIKIHSNIASSFTSFYASETGVEKTLYYDRKQIPAGASMGVCNICGSCGSDCQNCVTTTLNNDAAGCNNVTCRNCKVSYFSTINNTRYDIEATITPDPDPLKLNVYNFSVRSKGLYRDLGRIIELKNDKQPQFGGNYTYVLSYYNRDNTGLGTLQKYSNNGFNLLGRISIVHPNDSVISPNGNYIYVVGGVTGQNAVIQKFDANLNQVASVTTDLTSALTHTIVISPDGNYLYIAGSDLSGGNYLEKYNASNLVLSPSPSKVATNINPQDLLISPVDGAIFILTDRASSAQCTGLNPGVPSNSYTTAGTIQKFDANLTQLSGGTPNPCNPVGTGATLGYVQLVNNGSAYIPHAYPYYGGTNNVVWIYPYHGRSFTMSPDGSTIYVIAGRADQTVDLQPFGSYNDLDIIEKFDSNLNFIDSLADNSFNTLHFLQMPAAHSARYLFATSYSQILRIDTTNNSVVTDLNGLGSGTYGLAISPDGNYLYVSLYFNSIVQRFDWNFTSTSQPVWYYGITDSGPINMMVSNGSSNSLNTTPLYVVPINP